MAHKPIKPMLFPNEVVDTKDMRFPLIASHKMDGCRMLFHKGKLQTRSGKPVVNTRIHDKYAWLKTLTKTLGITLDGEFYSHELPRNEINSYFMSQDKELEDHLEFWCFDYLDDGEDTFETRHIKMIKFCSRNNIKYPESFYLRDSNQADLCMVKALENGYEGLILLSPTSLYKHGRITVKSGDGFKVKPYQTFDSKIVGVVQATEVDPDAPKKVNELGYSETSKKKGDRIPVEKAAAFIVDWVFNEQQTAVKEAWKKQVKVTLAMTDEEKEEVWKNRDSYLGKMIEWKGMAHGMKDVPSHPVMLRFREDLDQC